MQLQRALQLAQNTDFEKQSIVYIGYENKPNYILSLRYDDEECRFSIYANFTSDIESVGVDAVCSGDSAEELLEDLRLNGVSQDKFIFGLYDVPDADLYEITISHAINLLYSSIDPG